MLGPIVSSVLKAFPRVVPAAQNCSTVITSPATANPWGFTLIRTVVRNNLPHANENLRLKKHSWRKRMATLSGRKILMRRILKGKHVLSH